VLNLALDFRVLSNKEMSTQGERKKGRKHKIKKEREKERRQKRMKKINGGNIRNIEGIKCDFRFCWQ
jgi:hypothetical protein